MISVECVPSPPFCVHIYIRYTGVKNVSSIVMSCTGISVVTAVTAGLSNADCDWMMFGAVARSDLL